LHLFENWSSGDIAAEQADLEQQPDEPGLAISISSLVPAPDVPMSLLRLAGTYAACLPDSQSSVLPIKET
jgi:hypothetical protein